MISSAVMYIRHLPIIWNYPHCCPALPPIKLCHWD